MNRMLWPADIYSGMCVRDFSGDGHFFQISCLAGGGAKRLRSGSGYTFCKFRKLVSLHLAKDLVDKAAFGASYPCFIGSSTTCLIDHRPGILGLSDPFRFIFPVYSWDSSGNH